MRRFLLLCILLMLFCSSAGAATNYIVSFAEQSLPVGTLQFEFVFPSGATNVEAIAGQSAIDAQKGVSASCDEQLCSEVVGTVTRVRVLLFGLNQNALATGAVAHISADLDGATDSLPLENIVLSTPDGTAIENPVAPFLVTITTSHPRTVYVVWTDPIYPDVVGYELYTDVAPISSDNTLTPIVIDGRENRTYLFTGLPNATHYIRVAAVAGNGDRAFSNQVFKIVFVPIDGPILTIEDPPDEDSS